MSARRVALAAVIGYAAGTLPSAAVAARLARSSSDVSQLGSGNPGAFNTSQQLGRWWGIGVGLSDIAKGTVATWAGRRLGGDGGCYAAATAVVAGHVYPPSRRGGRGVATSFGATFIAFPLFAPIDLAVAAAVMGARRHAPKGTRSRPAVLASTSVFVCMSSLWAWKRLPNPGGPASGGGMLAYALATAALVLPRWVS
ncbi:MAG: glycerol-3-phosphate acyltransferase [Candidatus Dormibacteria bacterium]